MAIRLQLQVYRNGLPPAAVLWSLGDSKATGSHKAGTVKDTIAQFLERVNETLPLESTDWGLEDYVVEVNGFECLHFTEIRNLLRDGDEVCIRPLSTTDLQARKLSGRDQISYDGKHLVDGIAFGRPLLRSAPRPAVTIPPRKRRRLESRSENEENVSPQGMSLLPLRLQPHPEVASKDAQLPTQFSGQNLQQGRHVWGDDDSESDDADFAIWEDDDDDDVQSNDSETDDSEVEKTRKSEMEDELRDLTPSRVSKPAQAAGDGSAHPPHHSSSVRGLGLGFVPAQSSSIIPYTPQKENATHSRGPHFEGDWSSKTRSRTKLSGTGHVSSQTTPGSSKSVRFEDNSVKASRSEKRPNEESDESDDTDFEPTSDTDTDADADTGTAGDSSSTDSSSESSTSSDDSSITSKEEEPISQSTKQSTTEAGEIFESPNTVPPGQGLSRTRRRNERRKRKKHLERLQAAGVVSKEMTLRDLGESSISDVFSRDHLDAPKTRDLDIQRKRLLESLTQYGGIEVATTLAGENEPEKSSSHAEESASSQSKKRRLEKQRKSGKLLTGQSDIVTEESSKKKGLQSEHQSATTSRETSQPGHIKFDEKGNMTVERTQNEVKAFNKKLAGLKVDPLWKEKVLLSAVECVEPVQLPPPTFPFIQNWHKISARVTADNDQIRSGTSKKRKRGQHREASQAEESSTEPHDGTLQIEKAPDVYGAVSPKTSNIEHDHTPDDGDEDDFPALPRDISTLSPLQKPEIHPGMIVCFKHLRVNKDWHPELSNYRTAMVDHVDQARNIQMTLAKRDRQQREPEYDENGQKLYGRFQMPDDEAQSESDRGFLELSYEDLVEPRIVQHPTLGPKDDDATMVHERARDEEYIAGGHATGDQASDDRPADSSPSKSSTVRGTEPSQALESTQTAQSDQADEELPSLEEDREIGKHTALNPPESDSNVANAEGRVNGDPSRFTPDRTINLMSSSPIRLPDLGQLLNDDQNLLASS